VIIVLIAVKVKLKPTDDCEKLFVQEKPKSTWAFENSDEEPKETHIPKHKPLQERVCYYTTAGNKFLIDFYLFL